MKDLKYLTKEEILKISVLKPEKLFNADTEAGLKSIYRKMSVLWHPDKHMNIVGSGNDNEATNVFIHIKSLYEIALRKLKEGTLGKELSVKFVSKEGKEDNYFYKKEKSFELGKFYIGESYVIWCFLPEYKKNAEEGLKTIKNLKFADDKMKREFTKYVPEVVKKIETKDYFVVVIKKESGFINLRDVLDHYSKIEAAHMAWIIGTMYNLTCFYKYNNVMHGGITLDNYFINPENHEGYAIGGWWYSKIIGEKLEILSEVAVDVAPISLLNSKTAKEGLDLEMIKLAGRIMLGDSTGVYLRQNKALPERLVSWARDASSGNSFKDYEVWMNQVLKESFGVRRFIKMDLKPNDVYEGE